MRKHQAKWRKRILPIAWLASVIFFLLYHWYAYIHDFEWYTGYLLGTIFYILMPQGFLFGILFGRKEGAVWNLKWLLPVYYFAAMWLLLRKSGFDWLWFWPAGAAMIGLLIGFSVHQVRKKLQQNWAEKHPWDGDRLLEKLRR